MAIKMVFRPALEPAWMQQVKDLGITIIETGTEAEALESIRDADAFYGRITPDLLSAAKNLRWVQATSAGLDNFFFPELRASDVTVTNLRGIYSDVIADHVFAFILSFARGMRHYFKGQQDGKWAKGAPVIHLGEKTLGIIGLGGIGLEVAKRGHAFGMRVVGVDPAPKARPDYIERIWNPENLRDMLAESDFVAICVPHTGETEHMIDAGALAAAKPGSILINIGRGKVVDLNALVQALRNGPLGGAGLDVFEQEPLPEAHPLWAMENVLITPHVAGISPEIFKRRWDLIVENIRRFCNDEPLLNIVDKQRGYVVQPNP